MELGPTFWELGPSLLELGPTFIYLGPTLMKLGPIFFSKIFFTFELLLAQIFNLPQKNLGVHNYFWVKITESLTFRIGHLHGDGRFVSAPRPSEPQYFCSILILNCIVSSLMFMMALQCPKTFINFSGQIVHSIFSLYTEEAFVCCKHSHCRCRYKMYFYASERNIYDEVNFNCVKTNCFCFC